METVIVLSLVGVALAVACIYLIKHRSNMSCCGDCSKCTKCNKK